MTVIKMLRTLQDNSFIGDRTYTVSDLTAKALVQNGDAVLLEHLPDPTAKEIAEAGGKEKGKDSPAAKKKAAAKTKTDAVTTKKRPASKKKK